MPKMTPQEVATHPAFRYGAVTKPRQPSTAEWMMQVVLYASEQLARQGIPITVNTVTSQADRHREGITIAVVTELLKTPRMIAAFADRGLVTEDNGQLTADQLHALAIYTDMGLSANHAGRLRLAGVSESRWRGWKRNPNFERELAVLSEETVRGAQPVAMQRLSEAADRGERWAIEMVLEVTGRHDRRKETVDVNKVLTAVFAILDEEVPDVAILGRVADRVRTMMGAGAAPVLQITPAVRSLEDIERETEG